MTQKQNSLYGYAEKLSPEHTDGKPAVVRIATVAIRNFAKNGAPKPDWKYVVTYREFDGIEHPLNKTSYKTLSEQLGKYEPDDKDFGNMIPNHPWIGKYVALAPTTRTNPQDGTAVEKLDVAPLKAWERYFRSAGVSNK